MSTAETPDKPTVEELLVSIRQAIHGDNAARASLDKPVAARPAPKSPVHKFEPRNSLAERQTSVKKPVAASMNQMRVNLKPDANRSRGQRSNADSSAENFSKLREQLYEMGAAPSNRAKPPPKGAANGFAKILSGETRLEDALEKLRSAGLEPATDDNETPLRNNYHDDHDDFRFGDGDDDVEDDLYEMEDAEPPAQSGGFSPMVQEKYLSPPPVAPLRDIPPTTPSLAPTPHQAVQADNRVAEQAPPAPAQPSTDAPLTSAESAQATNAAFNKLAEAIVGHAQTGNQSIDQVTRELLRPMLKSWLDENLPRLVERLVRDEIERVARGGGK